MRIDTRLSPPPFLFFVGVRREPGNVAMLIGYLIKQTYQQWFLEAGAYEHRVFLRVGVHKLLLEAIVRELALGGLVLSLVCDTCSSVGLTWWGACMHNCGFPQIATKFSTEVKSWV